MRENSFNSGPVAEGDGSQINRECMGVITDGAGSGKPAPAGFAITAVAVIAPITDTVRMQEAGEGQPAGAAAIIGEGPLYGPSPR